MVLLRSSAGYPTTCPKVMMVVTSAPSSHYSDSFWLAANACPNWSDPNVVDCRIRNCRSCSTFHGARRPHKSDLFCNGRVKLVIITLLQGVIIIQWPRQDL